ncbi:hypothetical protein GCM10009716_38670 [Streptomyces sodiiphilus]|uniref:WbqC-like protein n=1 Tax=Streptomyces sodiiphilus TaxID=226217 RepID=A0ABP5AZL5_9ACTN
MFPRLTTLAKLFAADTWIVLDDVQFTRRDYQHRTRLAAPDAPEKTRWLSIPTHLPYGRSTLIRDAVIVGKERARRRAQGLVHDCYRSSPHWPRIKHAMEPVWDAFATGLTAAVAAASTRVLLDLLGWKGIILTSSDLPARPGRSQRLADLTAAIGATAYLCGTGGMKYLKTDCFDTRGIHVVPFRAPASETWAFGRENSALTTLTQTGVDQAAHEFRIIAARHRGVNAQIGSDRASWCAGPAELR